MTTWLTTITGVQGNRVATAQMRLDETGYPRPTGRVGTLPADAVVLALGQEADLALVASEPRIVVRDGVVHVDDDLMTGLPGIFAGGDAVPGVRTATVAVGHATRAARAIDAWLGGAAAREGRRVAAADAVPTTPSPDPTSSTSTTTRWTSAAIDPCGRTGPGP